MTKNVFKLISRRVVLLGLIMGVSASASAQFDGSEIPPDSTELYADTGMLATEPVEEKPAAPPPYVRIVMPVDTVTELISYKGIVDFGNCDFCSSDSLYFRARKFLVNRYGEGKEGKKEFPKGMVIKDQKPDKFFIQIKVPLHVKKLKSTDAPSGWYSCKIELRFSEPKYKYIITNFVHYYTQYDGSKDVEAFNYAEYYMQTKSNPKGNDAILRAIDAEVKQFLIDLNKAVKDPKPLYVDEDDWE